MERTILHCDLNGFFASVECLYNPSLALVPMAVAGNPADRHGIILAKNELAKKFGVQTAETIWSAKKKCPDLVLVPPRHGVYGKFSKLANQIYYDYTDMVEPFGIDESWLDVTGSLRLFGDGHTIADSIRRRMREELGLTVSVGVSFNKIFAKLGSDYKKPDATTVIPRDSFKEIINPLPVGDLLYVGRSANATLSRFYIKTIGDLANSPKSFIVSKLGKMGGVIWDYANGLDDSPVNPNSDHTVKSVGNGMTFRRDLVGLSDVTKGVLSLSEEVAYRMRKGGVKCFTVSACIKDTNLVSISRQKTLNSPTFLARDISNAAIDIISSSWNLRMPIRAITITASNLVSETAAVDQLSFINATRYDRAKQERIETTVDRIRDRYGKKAISIAGIMKNDIGVY